MDGSPLTKIPGSAPAAYGLPAHPPHRAHVASLSLMSCAAHASCMSFSDSPSPQTVGQHKQNLEFWTTDAQIKGLDHCVNVIYRTGRL
jgi:hypothetical protein